MIREPDLIVELLARAVWAERPQALPGRLRFGAPTAGKSVPLEFLAVPLKREGHQLHGLGLTTVVTTLQSGAHTA